MSKPSGSTNVSHARRTVALLSLALVGACTAAERVAAPAATETRPAHSLAEVLPGLGGAAAHVVECTLGNGNATADTALIGPDGGSLAIGRTRIEIPAGAVTSPETFVLALPASRSVQVEAHAIGYEHYAFATPVTVTVDFGRCGDFGSDEAPLHAWYVDADGGTALEDMGGVVDPSGHTLTFRTPHFSVYMLAE